MNLGKEIEYIDFHTHHGAGSADTVAVRNIMSGEDIPEDFTPNTLFSAGIHPWQGTADNIKWLKTELILTAAHPHVAVIGEAGFDRLKGPPPDVQRDLFRFQCQLAEEMHKPMVIHCVRGWDDLLTLRQEVKPVMPWVIHGFRGKPQLAETLAGKGFWFSLGLSGLKKEILDSISYDRLLLETDDTVGSITNVYLRLMELTHRQAVQITELIKANFNNLFS
ncbi:MAG: TatD family hydrolase [Bacteroidales bacterium]|jgi:TatD DNase family protein|nr:TatD family hydrolase [Bacteroidales bacterium]